MSLIILSLFVRVFVDFEYELDEDDEYYSDEELDEEDQQTVTTSNTHANKQSKATVLFTADDIIRMFPANENEMAKLEIEDEIRKLKASSEAAVLAATEEMKADFKSKINMAVAEIRNLREALMSSTCGKMGRKDSFSNPESSPLVSARKSPSPIDGKPPIRRRLDATGQQFYSLSESPTGSGGTPMAARSMYNLHSSTEAALGNRSLSPSTRLPAVASPVISAPPLQESLHAPPPATPAATTATPATVGPSEEVVQLQKEMEDLKGDIKDIKKLLGNILVKMK